MVKDLGFMALALKGYLYNSIYIHIHVRLIWLVEEGRPKITRMMENQMPKALTEFRSLHSSMFFLIT